jgi:cell wall assembly regulator SMI1
VSERFIYGDQLYPLSKMRDRWKGLAELAEESRDPVVWPVGPVQPVRDSPRRVPVASDDGTHYYFLDFDPAPGGQVGQIVLSFHDEPRIICAAPSFRAWLEEFANQLESGRYVYSARLRGLIPVERADG